MNAKERVRAAVHHRQPDRTPFLAFLTDEVASKLSDIYGLRDTDLFVHLGHDALVTIAGMWHRQWADPERLIDTWSIRWHKKDYGLGTYLEILEYPLADVNDPDRYTFPDPAADFEATAIRDVIRKHSDTHWIVGGPVGTIFETAWMLRGLEQFLIDLIESPTYAEALLDRAMAYHLELARRFIEVGARMWRRFFKPRYAAVYAELKRLNPGIVIAHHSDGHIEPIIPDFIEIGLDVLQAVQPQSMDPAKLKREYGDRLAFWGTMDVQHAFPYGTPEDVAAEARHRRDIVGKGGGSILAPSHAIQPDVPLANLRAYYESVCPERREIYARMTD